MLIDYVLVEVCLFPDIGYSGHVAVDVQREEVLIVVEAVDLLDAFNQVVEAKAKGISDVIEEAFVVALKDCLVPTTHLFHQLA